MNDFQESSSSITIKDHTDILSQKKSRRKNFEIRESEITILFKNPHLKTVHHIAIAFFLLLCFKSFLEDYLGKRDVISSFRLIVLALGGFHYSLFMWIFIYILVCCSYPSFLIWAKIRDFFPAKSLGTNVCDLLACLTLLGYYVFSFVFISQLLLILKLPIGSGSIIIVEQVRLLMKVHAFVRSNVNKILVMNEEPVKTRLPTFGHFIYFTWIPTLVYKDEYPRTSKTNWCKVTQYLLEIIAIIVLYSVVIQYSIPSYEKFGISRYSNSDIFLAYLETSLAGAVILVGTFYLVFHLLQNLFAELLCFGDRMFYKDWWNVTDPPTFFRRWNIVVQDWLYYYVYRDCHEILFPGRRNVAKLITIFVSAIVHEWMVSIIFGYFIPIMTALFISSAALLSSLRLPQHPIFNLFFWFAFPLGNGIMVTVYMFEFYVRYNEGTGTGANQHFFIPRMLTCDNCYSR